MEYTFLSNPISNHYDLIINLRVLIINKNYSWEAFSSLGQA